MSESSKRKRLWAWACSRGFAFTGYLMIAIAAALLFYTNRAIEADMFIGALAAFAGGALVLAGAASAHAVVYGIGPCNSFMVKLEIPALRILAIVITLHGFLLLYYGRFPGGLLEFGLASLLFHEMRSLSTLRKGTHGGLI